MTDDSFLKMLETNFPDLYAEMRKADDELGEISFRLAQVAREIVENKNKVKPPDLAARLTADIKACIDSSTSRIKSHYSMVEGLAEEYGKGFMGNEQSKQQFGLVSWAAALSDPQVAKVLRQAQQAIARAAVSLPLQMFSMLGGPQNRKEVELATENIKNAVAEATLCFFTRCASEHYPFVEKTSIPNYCSFTYYNTHNVVDEYATSYFRSRMNFNPR